MGVLFKKRSETAMVMVPADSKFDQRWSEDFDCDKFASSGVDPGNRDARAFLQDKRMVLIRYYGIRPMEIGELQWAIDQFNGYWARPDAKW